MNEQQRSRLEDIAAAVRNETCVLFLGAGVHAAPPSGSSHEHSEAARPLFGSEVSLRLAGKSGLTTRRADEDAKNLQRVSLDFELQKGRAMLLDEVRQAVQTDKKPSSLLHELAKLPFRLIITTNYDTHFEDALRSCGKQPIVSFYRSNVSTNERTQEYSLSHEPSSSAPFVLKIHGDIIQDPSSIVITDEDYIHFVLRMSDKYPFHPLPRTALYFISKWPTLFLGYSLRDYNLRILFKTLRWQLAPGEAPQMYSVDHRPDPLIVEVMQEHRREVKYVVQDAWSFVPELVKHVRGTP